MKLGLYATAGAGLALAIAIIVYSGVAAVAGKLVDVGWGLVAVSLFHLVPLVFSAAAWRVATAAEWPGSFAVHYWARLVREAVNDLLPAAHIGGFVLSARALTQHGAPAALAGAGVAVDVTMEVLSQFAFTVLGFALIVLDGGDHDTVRWAGVGMLVMAPALTGFVLAQRWGGLKLLEKLFDRLAGWLNWQALGSLATLHDTAHRLYARRRVVGLSFVLHFLCWAVGTGEVWLALRFMGHEISWTDAFILESLGQAVRSAAFVVPGALGVQEGGYVLLGAALGLGPETSLALSLAKRVREAALGVPTLIAWQFVEGRRLWASLGRKRAD